jgi:hypothetical protein
MLLWKIVEQSKVDTNFDSKKQYSNLVSILSQLPLDKVKQIEDEWNSVCNKIINNQFYLKLHMQEGGIVEGGDDTFFVDFPNWIVAQGEKLFNNFKNTNHYAIINYIKKHKITDKDYTYECFVYAFSEILSD